MQEQSVVNANPWTPCPNPVTPVGQNFQVTLSLCDTYHTIFGVEYANLCKVVPVVGSLDVS